MSAEARIDLNDGAGGRASARLIASVFRAAFDNPHLNAGNDSAVLPWAPAAGQRLVMSTDAHVVSPLFFPGGDIGSLAVHGTLNDLATSGAQPLYLSASFILEEGLLLADLKRIVASMAEAARAAGVPIVTGDTKVVARGQGDGVFITTTAVGAVNAETDIGGQNARVGDAILINGSIGDHGIAIMAAREQWSFATPLHSDSAALHTLVQDLLAVAGHDVHVLRDPTRGGVGCTLNEIAQQSQVGIQLEESALRVRPPVHAACELLGLDPLYIANEGKMLVICAASAAPAVLAAMRAHPLGQEAAQIGEVIAEQPGWVRMRTLTGGQRKVDWLSGLPLPRIC